MPPLLLVLPRRRSAFDPKSFYKKADATKFPKHFQMGTVVEGAADFYSGAPPTPDKLTTPIQKRAVHGARHFSCALAHLWICGHMHSQILGWPHPG